MSKTKDLHRQWSTDAKYRTVYDALNEEFALARILIQTRSRAGLSQAQLAERMRTSQSYIARIEGGRVRPSTAVLERLARATGTRLKITFERKRAGRVAASDRPARASR
ncbi:MAG: helix-turn-helix transcriptional regulator [Acidobacteria bacterium]|nr:helix-turn-helix transcriptional regulator [Acidobacteriota bacterium]